MRASLLVVCAVALGMNPVRGHLLAQGGQLSWLDAGRLDAYCREHSPDPAAVCPVLAELAGDDGTMDRGRAHAVMGRVRTMVDRHSGDPAAWFTLGLSHLVASRAGVIASPGPLQPPGVSHEATAGYAFVKALELDSTFLAGAEAAALAPFPREGASRMKERLTVVRRFHDRLSPVARFSAARIEREAGSVQRSVEVLEELIAGREIPPGGVYLELARDLHRLGRSEEGRRAMNEGARDTVRASVTAYRETLALVASPAELAEWDRLAPDQRSAWVEAFWRTRDVTDGWPEGTRLVEHFRRVEYAWEHYRTTRPTTGRHLVSGRARSIDLFADELLARMWVDESSYRMVDPETNKTLEEFGSLARMVEQRDLATNSGLFHYFRGVEEGLDDRGLIWIRHGKPDRQARSTGGEALEMWVYDRAGGPLILSFREENFDGQAGASTLVPTFAALSPNQRQQFCHLHIAICPNSADPSGTELTMVGQREEGNPDPRSGSRARQMPQSYRADAARMSSGAYLEREFARGTAALTEAVTSDANHRRFTRTLQPVVQLFGVTPTDGRSPRIIAVFALPGDQLVGTLAPDGSGRTIYPVTFSLHAASHRDGRRVELDTVRQFATAAPLGRGQYITGMLEVPITPGSHAASLVVSQSDGGGAIARINRISAPPAGVQFAVSDLVLGLEGSGTAWNSGSGLVALNPMNSYQVGGTASAYFQVTGLAADTPYEVRFDLIRNDAQNDRASLSLSFNERSSGQIHEVQRDLGLGSIEPGNYRVRVTVKAEGRGEAVAESWMVVVRKK